MWLSLAPSERTGEQETCKENGRNFWELMLAKKRLKLDLAYA
jgi:hypothetical protein